MEPPAYTTPQPPAPHRSIHDLRAQLLANASILRPRNFDGRPSDDHLEVVVAKVATLPPEVSRMSEKQALAKAYNAAPVASSSSTTGKHYAMVIQKRYTKSDVRIVLKGEPRDTVEEALEWVLERTEMEIHEMVVKHGKAASDADCCVM